MKIILLLFLVAFSINSKAQFNDISVMNFKNLSQVFTPSPNASSLAKFSEIEVNKHTGIPSIGADILNWKSKRNALSLNIGLSYHAGGIKVEDVASNVGIGWSLNAGGIITRSVFGIPDEEPNGFINRNLIPDYNTPLYTGSYYNPPHQLQNEFNIMDTSRKSIIAFFNDPSLDNSATWKYYSGLFDTQQDIFYYNFGNYNGKFVLDIEGNVNLLDKNDLIIQRMPNGKFQITTPEGVKYEFLDTENTQTETYSNGQGGNSINFTSSYYLSRIVDNNSLDTIKFYYQDHDINYLNGWNESVDFHDNDDPKLSLQGITTNGKLYKELRSHSYTRVENSKHIKKIEFPDYTTVDFIYENLRADLIGDFELNRIKISDVQENKKEYRLRYNYSNATNVTTDIHKWNTYPVNDNYFNLRLNLDKIDIVSGNDSLLYYQFQYNPIKLPPRSSKEIDFWGYYLGSENDSYTLLPKIHPYVFNDPLTEGVFENTSGIGGIDPNAYTYGADRRPNPNFSKAGTLEKIIYPTGGYTSFLFEGNTISEPSLIINTNEKIATYQTSHLALGSRKFLQMPDRNDDGVVFEINFKRVNEDGSIFISKPYDPNLPQTCLDGTIEMTQIGFTVESNDGSVIKTCNFNAIKEGKGKINAKFFLPFDKVYRITYQYDKNGDQCLDSVFFAIETKVIFKVPNDNKNVGGIRVKKIEYASLSNSATNTFYDYSDLNGITTGAIPAMPNFEDHYYSIGKWFIPDSSSTAFPLFLGHANYKSRGSQSTQTLGYSFGGNVGYEKVTVKNTNYNESESLGKEVSLFSTIKSKNFYDVYPYKTSQILNWESGLLLESKIYNNQEILLKDIEYSYLIDGGVLDSQKNRSVRIQRIRSDELDELNPISFARYVANAYYPYYGKSLLIKKEERNYSLNNYLANIYTYTYKGFTSIRGSSSLSNNSNGETIIEKYFYPTDFSNNSMQQLAGKGVIGIPVSKRTSTTKIEINYPEKEIRGEAIDYSISQSGFSWPYQFSNLASEGAVINPVFSNTSVKQSNDIVVGQINQYDNYGNVCEILGIDGITTVTIWSYKNTLPVAKIIGKSYYEIKLILTESILINLNLSVDNNFIETTVNNLRNTLSNIDNKIQVFSYTYAPIKGLLTEVDNNGFAKKYEYDNFDRLIYIRDNDNKILKKICYNYYNQAEDCTPVSLFYNEWKSGVFYKNDCAGNLTGSQVTYIVPENTYSSIVSKADADALAQADVYNNGQAYANINGTCTNNSNVSITYSNTTGFAGFTAVYTSLATSQSYSFNIPLYGSGTLGNLPLGTYSLIISKPPVGLPLLSLFGSGCSYISGGFSATFPNVNVSLCNNLTIDIDF